MSKINYWSCGSIGGLGNPEVGQDIAPLHVLRPEPDLPVRIRLVLHQGSSRLTS